MQSPATDASRPGHGLTILFVPRFIPTKPLWTYRNDRNTMSPPKKNNSLNKPTDKISKERLQELDVSSINLLLLILFLFQTVDSIFIPNHWSYLKLYVLIHDLIGVRHTLLYDITPTVSCSSHPPTNRGKFRSMMITQRKHISQEQGCSMVAMDPAPRSPFYPISTKAIANLYFYYNLIIMYGFLSI